MDRRYFSCASACAFALALTTCWRQAHALGVADLSTAEASQGLKAAVERGAGTAVGLLGRPDGFLGNPKVRIPLPGFLQDAAKFLRALGRGQQVDELETAMNRAAEAAVPLARELLVAAVRGMNVTDAKNILMGGETSVTAFFAEKTRAPLAERFLPVVSKAVEKVGLVEKYNQVAAKVKGLVKPEDPSIQHYVTRKSLDGLYLMIAEEEKKIRQDPLGTGSALLKKVFGALK